MYLSLPSHSQCPLPLTSPRTGTPTRDDPHLHRTTPLPLERRLRPQLCDEWSLHPLLISQIKSVRPEAPSRHYIDWFSQPNNQICRFAPPRPYSAWDYQWSPSLFGWLCPPISFLDAVCAKVIRDASQGILILPASYTNSNLTAILSRSHIIFDIPWQSRTIISDGPKPLPTDFRALIFDNCSVSPTRQQHFTIQVHPDWKDSYNRCKSPFVSKEWLAALHRYPGAQFVNRLCDGIDWGRSFSFTGDRTKPVFCHNRFKALIYHKELDTKIEQEREQGFRFGPFRCPEGTPPPLFNLKCHPRSAAIKKFSHKIRLVVDMSSPYDGTSVNAVCPDIELHYVKLDNAASVLKKLGQGTLLLKFDVTAAYKQIRLIIDDWCLQGEMYKRNGVTCFDISTAANFGAKSSGFLWEEYGSALEFVLRWSVPMDAIMRYVDDYLVMIRPHAHLTSTERLTVAQTQIITMAKRLGVTLDKFDSGTCLEFLGITIDTDAMCFRVPQQKKTHILAELAQWSTKSSCRKRELDSLIGYLQFITRVIPWGRAFLGRCIRISCSKTHPNHHIRLNNEFRLDVKWWQSVLPTWSGISFFYDDDWLEPPEFEVDASLLGHGCYNFPHYYSEPWSPSELAEAARDRRESMPFLELLAIAKACATFCHDWSGKRVLCRSDCEPASFALTNKYSRVPQMQRLIRVIGVLALHSNFDIRVKHITTLHNIRADPLSRLDIPSFAQVEPRFSKLSRIQPAPLPSTIFENP